MEPWFAWPGAAEKKAKMAKATSRLLASALTARPCCESIVASPRNLKKINFVVNFFALRFALRNHPITRVFTNRHFFAPTEPEKISSATVIVYSLHPVKLGPLPHGHYTSR